MKKLFSKHKESDVPGEFCSPPARDGKVINFQREELPEPDFSEASSDSRTLHIQYDAYWNAHTTVRVYDTDQTTELYTIEARYRKPQMTIRSNSSGDEVATADFHILSTRIDMTLHGQPLTLKGHGFMGVQYSYTSLAFNGEKMNWRPRKKLDDLNMVLLNGNEIAIARYKPNYKGSKQGGTLEMLAECLSSDQLMEEVVVAGLAVIHYKESQRMSAVMSAAIG